MVVNVLRVYHKKSQRWKLLGGEHIEFGEKNKETQQGHSISTKNKKPFILVYKKEYKLRSKAVREERRIKSQKNRIYIENLIKTQLGP